MMNMATDPSCYANGPQNIGVAVYGVSEETMDPNSSSPSTHPTSFLYNLSLLKDKVHQIQSLASIFPESTALATPVMSTLIQEIIVAASSMMFSCQQMSIATSAPAAFEMHHNPHDNKAAAVERGPPETFFAHHQDTVDHWYGESSNYNNCNSSNDRNNGAVAIGSNSNGNSLEDVRQKESPPPKIEIEGGETAMIIELEAADLLAKYTHYCHVCGKGFKRDANLRMHMRAHGDEYKSSAALSNPMKNDKSEGVAAARKYSCPQEGCRWNKKHARFQPLKSMICVKNHYKRSHCPKMYVCKRCNRKHFSVLSDLRTHEKHCGDLKWQCTCGTTFSRKDKLMGHVTLFVGHAPAINPFPQSS